MVNIKILNNNKQIEVKKGTRYLEIAKMFESEFENPIVLAKVDGKVKELTNKFKDDIEITFLDVLDTDGFRVYQRSLGFLYIKSVKDVYKKMGFEVDVNALFTVNRGLYTELISEDAPRFNQEILEKIETRMREYIAKDTPIKKQAISTSKARKIFQEEKLHDKVNLFKYRSVSNTNIYILDEYKDYFYGYMVPSCGELGVFKLHLFDKGIMLQYSENNNPKKIAKFDPDKKLYKTLAQTYEWAKLMDIENIGSLNDVIAKNGISEMVLVAEALMEKKISDIADKIVAGNKAKKFIFIAGPSSSGKTTFANRLGIQLRALGYVPKVISLDNYYIDREYCPKDENGNLDLEALEAIDVKRFNKDMIELLNGKKVRLPIFNFLKGKSENNGPIIELGDKGIFIIEGIHGLNDKLSDKIPKESKFKIYISALTQLNLDNHNRIPSTDGRLLRRIVRDFKYRGSSATNTIGMWPSVRNGEEKHIFPFQEQADVMFNSALIYEFAILKEYALPVLYSVEQDSPEFMEAHRLIKFLDYIIGFSSENIPNNSLIREFIGGSCFR